MLSADGGSAGGAASLKTFHAKLVLLGDASVGKSSIVNRFAKEEFDEYQDSTIGAAFVTQSLKISSNTMIRFEIWDTAGSERYRALAPMYYRGAAAAIVVYDITSRDSFENSKTWIAELKSHNRPDSEAVVALAGNKLDLEEARAVPTAEAEQYASAQGVLFRETSAKNGANVADLFCELGLKLPRKTNTDSDTMTGFQIRSDTAAAGSGGKSTLNSVWSCCRYI